MIWFGKSFIKFGRSFIKFRENFRVRTFCHVYHLIKDASINGFSG